MKKRILINLFFVCILLMTLLNISSAIAQEKVVRYGGQYYPEEFLLKGYDFFSEFGLNVKHTIFSSGTENNEALVSGNIDINVGSDSKSVALFNAIGSKALIIGTVQRGDRYSTIIRKDSKYTDWSELRGKIVGTRFGTGAELVLRKYFLTRPDLSWDDFKWVNIKTEDMIATLDKGQIEAFTVWAPTGEIAEAQGVGKSLISYGDVSLVPVCIHTTREFAENNKDLIVRFLAAHLKKADMIKNNPGLAAEYANKAAKDMGINIDTSAFEIMFKRINFQIDFDESIIEELKNTAEFLISQGKIKEIPEFFWDTSYIEEAKRLVK